jgi:toxin ParE1/3/4
VSPARLRPLAETDLVERTRYYRLHGGELAARFFDAATTAIQAVERMPGIGSLRVGELCGVPGLRARRITGFPCSWLYLTVSDHVDVLRLLADARDLTAVLSADE